MKRLPDKTTMKNTYLDLMDRGLPEQVFLWVFALLLVIHCVENTSVIYSDALWVRGMYLFRNLLYLVLVIKAVLFSRYREKEFLTAILFLAAGAAAALGSHDFILLETFAIMLAMKGQDSRKVMMLFLMIKGVSLLLTPLLWKAGILEALYYQDDVVGYYNTYGFCHRNVLGANAAVLCLAWFYLRYKVLGIRDVVAWTLIAGVTYLAADSMTSLIIMVLTIFGVWLFRLLQERIVKIPHLNRIVLAVFAAFLLISIIGTLFYSQDSEVWKLIDSVFTKRFRFAHQCFTEYGLSLFGKNIDFVSSIQAQNTDTAKLILDNSYMRAILYYGLVPGLLFLGTYAKALDESCRRRNFGLLLSLLLFALYGMSERYMLDAYYQFPLLIAWNRYFFPHNPKHPQKLATAAERMQEAVLYLKRKRP